MQASTPPMDIELSPLIRLATEAQPRGTDLIFLPTNSEGTRGELNSRILSNLGLKLDLPRGEQLNHGYSIVPMSKGLICFIMTVGSHMSTAAALRTYLTAALKDPSLARAKTLWIPLLGTGAGRLAFGESFSIIFNALKEWEPIKQGAASAVISLPRNMSAEQNDSMFEALQRSKATSSDTVKVPLAVDSLPLSQSVSAILEWATDLALRGPDNPPSISTILLFFALVESQSPLGPTALRDDPAAGFFSDALRHLAKDKYAPLKDAYFAQNIKRHTSNRASAAPQLSINASAILSKAHTLAGGTNSSMINIDHLVQALLSYEHTRLRATLKEALGIEPPELLGEYQDARIGQVAARFNNDVATSEDRLGYDRYAKAIYEFISHTETPPPLSISIQAPWGAGKSSLMRLIREKLDPCEDKNKFRQAQVDGKSRLELGAVLRFLDREEPFAIHPESSESSECRQLWTVWFNAWQYDTTEQVWAGLVDAIVSQIAERLPLLEREKFLLKLQLARIDDGIVRKRIYDRVISIWWSKVRAVTLTACAATISMLAAATAGPVLPNPLGSVLGTLSSYGFPAAVLTQAVLWLGLAASYFHSRSKTRTEPASFSLAEFMRVPDYNKALGDIHQIHADLKRVLKLVPRSKSAKTEPTNAEGAHEPIVIFIDDLDRCAPGKIANLVEGVSMLLASNSYRCMFVIGMDPQMVAAALEKAHQDVRDQLPSYERAVPLGWRFMDKFIQLPFTIPPSTTDQLSGYVSWLVDPAVVSSGSSAVDPANVKRDRPETKVPSEHMLVGNQTETNTDASSSASSADQVSPPSGNSFAESRDVGAIIREAALYTGNPREMKRMVNLARFYLTLRAARRDLQPQWKSPSREQYARWIAITLRWPDMLRWLQWGADEAHWTAEERRLTLIVRRLRLMEKQASVAATAKNWRDSLKSELNVPIESDSDWACDSKLFEFFQDEHLIEEGRRLSDAADRGFW